MGRVLCLVVAALCLALAHAAPSSGYVLGGAPWPQGAVTYQSESGVRGRAVDRAARVWNRARVGIRLRRTTVAGADVQIRIGRWCGGFATIGYVSRPEIVRLGKGCGVGYLTLLAVHEFGHVLGLDHERRRCAAMNPTLGALSGTPSRCRRHTMQYWLKHPLQRDDVHGARRLYSQRASLQPTGPLFSE